MATHNTQDADSKRSQPSGTYNDLLNDTQFIPLSKPESLEISSQSSKAQNIRLLSENEENRIIDSSLDFKDSISTQALLEKEPDTVVIKENEEVHHQDGNQDEVSIRLSNSQSSAPFKNFKLPDGDSPWLSKVKDPFSDSETPWLNKMRDPFKETPINTKVFDALNETPSANKKLPDSLNTPTTAHKIFQRLRENNNRPEFELDSQSIPAMFKDTQPILDNAIEEEDEDSHLDDTSVNNTTMNDDTTHDNENGGNSLLRDDSTVEIEPTKPDNTSQEMNTTQLLEDTVPIEENHRDNDHNDFTSDNTQADIQVPGTAPDANVSMDVEESTIIEDSKDHASIEKNEDQSSPVNSDAEEESFSLNLGRRLHSEPIGGDYLNIMAEDSIQKYHRDLGKKFHETPVHQLQNSQDSKPFADDTLKISQGRRLNSLPSKLDNTDGIENILEKQSEAVLGSSNDQSRSNAKSQPTSSLKIAESSLAVHDKDTDELQQHKKSSQVEDQKESADINGLAENITQEFSDVDDDSKIGNSFVEENLKLQEEDNMSSSNKIRKSSRTKGKRIDYTSSPEKTFNQEDLSVILDAKVSQHGIDDYEISSDKPTQDPPAKEFPSSILREEKDKLTENDIAFKNSIWFLDNTRYYPGVIVGLSENGLNVKFFESTNEVTGSIFPLDIQIGDHVKVERASYVVTGLECVIKNNEEDVVRCMRGYDTVYVKKLKGKGKRQKIIDNEFCVPLEEVRIENEDWHLRSRVLGEEQMIKPKRFLANKSKNRKRLLPKSYNEDELISSAPVKRPKSKASGIFDRCVFVITGDVDKDSLAEKIETNGGFVLEEGFAAQIGFSAGEPTSDFFQNYNFAALITKKALRSSKFLESVALGWPLLSQEFIEESIYQQKLFENIYSFALPSGESSRMRGPKSADLSLFIQKWRSGYDLSSQLNNNKFLKDNVVFLCSKKNEQITKFMFQILGSKEVVTFPITNYTNFISKVSQYSQNAKILVYHDKVGVIKSTLSSEKSKKSKKGSILSQVIPSNQECVVDLVDWEWLVQCIISGNLWNSKEQFKI